MYLSRKSDFNRQLELNMFVMAKFRSIQTKSILLMPTKDCSPDHMQEQQGEMDMDTSAFRIRRISITERQCFIILVGKATQKCSAPSWSFLTLQGAMGEKISQPGWMACMTAWPGVKPTVAEHTEQNVSRTPCFSCHWTGWPSDIYCSITAWMILNSNFQDQHGG